VHLRVLEQVGSDLPQSRLVAEDDHRAVMIDRD